MPLDQDLIGVPALGRVEGIKAEVVDQQQIDGEEPAQRRLVGVVEPWLATFADPLRAQSAIDRFVNNAYDLEIEGESYRKR